VRERERSASIMNDAAGPRHANTFCWKRTNDPRARPHHHLVGQLAANANVGDAPRKMAVVASIPRTFKLASPINGRGATAKMSASLRSFARGHRHQ